MSVTMVGLMKWKYTQTESWKWRKWREHVSHDSAANKMEIPTAWESKVAGTCQPWWCVEWNGNTVTHFLITEKMAGKCQAWWCSGCSWNRNTHKLELRVESGRNTSGMMVPLMKRNYALPVQSQHCGLLPPMIASSRLDHSLYPFPHPEIYLLSLRMEECHPWREWNMNRFCTVDFVQGPNQTQTLP